MVLFIDNVLEFWVDENHYFGGDFYGYRRAPVVVQLLPGRHKLDIRLIRDVRAMDGIGSPKISISMRAEAASNGLAIASHRLLASNVVNGRLASEFASVPVRNDSKDSIEITSITSQAVCPSVNSIFDF